MLFDKPQMIVDLLQDPPFWYLHEIFLATMDATGFGQGLFTQIEMDSKYDHGKPAQIKILQKIIRLTRMTLGKWINVNLYHIVEGSEPEKTNNFLQQFYLAATMKVDSTQFVRKILMKEQDQKYNYHKKRNGFLNQENQAGGKLQLFQSEEDKINAKKGFGNFPIRQNKYLLKDVVESDESQYELQSKHIMREEPQDVIKIEEIKLNDIDPAHARNEYLMLVSQQSYSSQMSDILIKLRSFERN
ncbi:hypothetical protein FGO68_gene5261 [Halteria grandinella]|uniref:TRAF3-interacting protein 1 N-terminal domain-containing protein n=1 Tax=Halteria grandinella TaxID=5974 RepID=A0A8J8NFY1_HALGN|nr:hypothetical protein FGO68_gene5261 [Halteria grandinella]